MTRFIDLRSDTVTKPTPEMRQAMMTAEVGDDVFWDDPTVIQLERFAAKCVGKEAALFVPTGSMGNLVAILTHTRPGDEIVLGAQSHIARHELGAAARFGGVGYALADNPDTWVYPEDVKRLILPKDFFNPDTTLICLENALFNGDVVPLNVIRACFEAARERNVPVHLDGARVFNAAVSLGVDAADICAFTDSVMFCLSKGLCAPVGSMLCGAADFIGRARKNRKLLGGGMREAGVLAACGLIALEKMTARLPEDHENARYLAEKLAGLPGINADAGSVKINMVYWTTDLTGFSSDAFVAHMREAGVKVLPINEGRYRFVTNNDVSRADIDFATEALGRYIGTLIRNE